MKAERRLRLMHKLSVAGMAHMCTKRHESRKAFETYHLPTNIIGVTKEVQNVMKAERRLRPPTLFIILSNILQVQNVMKAERRLRQ